jgi:acyl-CoA reductase-like NAD-dependent aldehyde dehydrogenase
MHSTGTSSALPRDFMTALETAEPGGQVRLLIGGTWRNADCNATFMRQGPLAGTSATVAAAAAVSDANQAAYAAAAALPGWSSLGPNARREALFRAANALDSRAAPIADAMQRETGATPGWSGFNLKLACGMIREAAALTTQIGGDLIPSDKPGCVAMAVREPAGVVLGIAPWNAPVILGVRAIAMPLACGNTVILKSSELCPLTHALIGEAFAEALPPGVINVISNHPQNAAEIVAALIAHPAVRRINFTGSTRVGRIVARLAAEQLKPALLELGGKAPLIVLDDADLDEAVRAAAFGAFMNQGQICMSTERIIVLDSVADAFAEKLVAKARSLTAGDPREGNTILGPMIDARAVHHVRQLADDARADGATVYAADGAGDVFLGAVVADHVTPDMRLFREESFGPIVGITRARDEDHAVALANDTDYGLSAAVFTRDIARGLRVARRIKSGICHINGPTVHDEAQMPFGGTKASGYGRFGGRAGIDAFTELRWITVETELGHYPI